MKFYLFDVCFFRRFYQNNTDLLIRKLPFARLVREVQTYFYRKEFRFPISERNFSTNIQSNSVNYEPKVAGICNVSFARSC